MKWESYGEMSLIWNLKSTIQDLKKWLSIPKDHQRRSAFNIATKIITIIHDDGEVTSCSLYKTLDMDQKEKKENQQNECAFSFELLLYTSLFISMLKQNC